MTDRIIRAIPASASAVVIVVLGAWCPAALGSSGITPHCDEMADPLPEVETPALSLTIQLAEHGPIDAESDINEPVSDPSNEEVPAPALTDSSEPAADDDSEDATIEESDAAPRKTPETALHLPGVSAEDQPRFRRQMYRTDI